MMGRVIGSLSLAVLGLMLTGCATWVNIPSQPGDVARHNPNISTVVRLQSTALEAVIRDQSIPEPILITLPEGVNPNSINIIRATLSRTADVVTDPQAGAESHLDLRTIRIRGFDGEADIVRTIGGGVSHLVTVYLQDDIVAGWHAKRLRTWRGSVQAAPNRLTPVEEAELEHEPVRERVEVQVQEAETIEESWQVDEEVEVDTEVDVETTPDRVQHNEDVVEVYN